jgi:hypothetical protein
MVALLVVSTARRSAADRRYGGRCRHRIGEITTENPATAVNVHTGDLTDASGGRPA